VTTKMKDGKRKRLEKKGWVFGTVKEFLGLTDDEEAYIELRLRLADGLKERRKSKGMTQVALAESLKSSQSRVAKMEAGDSTVSLDLLIKSLLSLGASNRDLAAIIGKR
jgi:ribosome-binding protein aMBF1 (putative translation factor)